MFSFSSIFPVGTVNLDYDIFVHVPKLDAKDLKTVQRLYRADDLDFRLRPGSAAVDRGVVLHNVTEGFTGSPPDLGALEIVEMPPHSGPRQETRRKTHRQQSNRYQRRR